MLGKPTCPRRSRKCINGLKDPRQVLAYGKIEPSLFTSTSLEGEASSRSLEFQEHVIDRSLVCRRLNSRDPEMRNAMRLASKSDGRGPVSDKESER